MANNKTTEKDVQGQLEKLRGEISGITTTLTNLGANKLTAAKDKAEKLYNSAKENSEDIVSQAKDKIGDFEQTMNQCVRKNPCKSILFAAGVGFVLAQLLRR
ncbi:ElaB/YqjD/DUF883 family membrane-anchored ribosome-binding protein [Bartonella callosciuri]|uniref:ElaB/YqjD/DUF883 family membrane-anchored ribosome-binding protein n=1 Tax=Bartonella callosciuri TaxID=686223 RepID=A0A840NRH2_9HYPH|nr:DUF883 family protein [Bartonella callosciuri]MBB5074440.1 ElaB/YqjD/DUF883 family membrane-anchored ribosome-binding protein [Bartonella callosciuri]